MIAFGFVDENEKRQCPVQFNRVLVERNWMSIIVLQCFNVLLYQSRALSWGKQKLPLPTVPNDCTSKGFPSLWQCSLIPGPHRAFSNPGPTPWPATGSPLTPATHMKAPSALWPATFTNERELIMERLGRKWGDRGELTDVEEKAVGYCCWGRWWGAFLNLIWDGRERCVNGQARGQWRTAVLESVWTRPRGSNQVWRSGQGSLRYYPQPAFFVRTLQHWKILP